MVEKIEARRRLKKSEETKSMSTKNSRSGGKYSGNHTAVTPVAAIVCDIAHAYPEVTKISPGFLKMGLRPTGGIKRVKIVIDPSGVFITARGNSGVQELMIYSTTPLETATNLEKDLKTKGFIVNRENTQEKD